jgi:hypothetical protein
VTQYSAPTGRNLGDVARIELPAWDLPAARAVPGLSQAIARAGFTGAAVEYAAFSSGSLNGPPGRLAGLGDAGDGALRGLQRRTH